MQRLYTLDSRKKMLSILHEQYGHYMGILLRENREMKDFFKR